MASAEPRPLTNADFAGRWASMSKRLTLDLAPCGEEWCGVVVKDDACGHTVLRMSQDPADAPYQTDKNRELAGRLLLAVNAQPYGVHATLMHNDKGVLTLHIAGHSGGVFSPIRRSYDFNEVLARVGDASCAPNPKTS